MTQGSVGDVLGAAGPCPTVAWREGSYKVGWATPEILATVELQIAKAAVAENEELAAMGLISPEQASIDTVLRSRHHRCGGPLWNEAFKTVNGTRFMLWACVQAHHPEFSLADAGAMMREAAPEVRAATLIVMPGFTRLVGAILNAPQTEIDAQIQRQLARSQKAPSPT